ncbi:MAG: PspA/IM30 family protein [Thermodesulfobacteriota bacterium]
MQLLNKIFTSLRGSAREAGEAYVDRNGIRIFEQEIAEAKQELEKAKRDLTSVMAKEMQTSRKMDSLGSEITKNEGFATQALEKGNEPLAMEVAEKIASLQEELVEQEEVQKNYVAHIDRLKAMIKKTTKALTDMQRQLGMVKTTESVQKATTAITQSYASGSSKLLSAKESLDRIKQKQQDLDDRLKAGEALNDDFEDKGLEEKLKEAGIGESSNKASEILANLKAKKK